MRDEPDALALIDLVAGAIRRELVPALTGAAAYQARIAAHLLDLVARELRAGAADDAAELASLRALLARGDGDLATLDRALADALHDGRLEITDAAVARHLRAATRAKLAIDQPGWPRRLDD